MSITFSAQNDETVYLNCSNSSAFALMDLLQIDADYAGSIQTSQLTTKIAAARATLNARPNEFAASAQMSTGQNGAIFITAEVTPDRFVGFLDRLELIVEDAHAKNIPYITWA